MLKKLRYQACCIVLSGWAATACSTLDTYLPGKRGSAYHADGITTYGSSSAPEGRQARSNEPAHINIADFLYFAILNDQSTRPAESDREQERLIHLRQLRESGDLANLIVDFEIHVNDERKLHYRNTLFYLLISASDRNCNYYLENARSAQAYYRSLFGVSSILFGAAGGIFTNSAVRGASSVLSGASSGIAGQLDQNLFSDVGMEMLARGIRNERAAVIGEMTQRVTTETSYVEWPLAAAISAAESYHALCTVGVGADSVRATLIERSEALQQSITALGKGSSTDTGNGDETALQGAEDAGTGKQPEAEAAPASAEGGQ